MNFAVFADDAHALLSQQLYSLQFWKSKKQHKNPLMLLIEKPLLTNIPMIGISNCCQRSSALYVMHKY